MGFEVISINRNFTIGTKHPQTYSVLIKKKGTEEIIVETEPRQCTVVAQKLFGTRPIDAAEIGVLQGDHARLMLDALNINKLHLIDSFVITWDYEDQEFQDNNLNFVLKRFKGLENVEVFHRDSIRASKSFQDASLDFVYIDANHLYEFVKADIDAWLPKVKKGGIIGGHDYDFQVAASVKRAVHEKFGDKFQSGQNQNGLHDWWVINE